MSDAPRAALVLPGRGSYTAASLGSLSPGHAVVDTADALRAAADLPSLSALDAVERFDPREHLRPTNAAPLILVASLLDAETAMADQRVVVVVGNSLGWYAALAVAGVLAFADAFRLVQEVALLQEEALPGTAGGQVIYPLQSADWEPDPELAARVADLLANRADEAEGGRVYESVELGGYAVLAGDEVAMARMQQALPPVTIRDRTYPLRLALHGPYHTPLMTPVAAAAAERLADLEWRAPTIPLVDGTGRRWTPFATDPAALRDYTLGPQMTATYRFATSLRVALREDAPDLLALTGPGNSLGGVCGQLVVAEGYHGVRSRAELEARQASGDPLVLSMRR